MVLRVLFASFLIFILMPRGIAQPLKVVSEILPPYQVISDNGQFQGRAVDLVTAILTEADYADTAIDVMPWARAYKMAQKEQNVAIFSMAYSDKRAALFHWIGPLYALERSSLIGLKDREELAHASLEGAKQHRICSELDTYSYQYLQKQGFEAEKNLFTARGILSSYRTENGGIARPAQMLSLLKTGKCDYITGLWSIYAYSENNSEDLKPYFYMGDPNSPLILNLALSLNSSPEVIERLSSAYQTLRQSGVLYRLCVKDDPEKSFERSCRAVLPEDNAQNDN